MSSPPDTEAGTAMGQATVVAFLSATGGTGRTSAVANLAWVLSSAGRRVLVIDWGSEVPRIGEYLEPFYVEHVPIPDPLGRGLVAAYASKSAEDPWPPSVDRFSLPGAAGHIDVIAPPEDARGAFPEFQYGDPVAVTELRALLTTAEYDHVLIDAPTGSAESSLTLIATLCDLAVVCFRPRPRAIADAADLATRLRRRAPIRIDLVPVATLFDDGHESRAEMIRGTIRAAFSDLLAGQAKRVAGNGVVEIPYRPYDAFDPLLAILVEGPEQDGGLEAQYGRLAAAVTSGIVTTVTPVPPVLRARYRRVFGLDSTVEPDRILVAYTARDRPWADWVRGQLDRAGARTALLGDDRSWLDSAQPPGMVIVSSANLADSGELADLTAALAEAEADGRRPDVLWVVVDEPGPAPEDGASVCAVGRSEQELRARVLNHFGLIDRPGSQQVGGTGLPGEKPGIFVLPPRHPLFVGRDDDLERLRDELTAPADGRVIVTLSGVPGIGKSELALEYAHRFANDYDLVWWVPSGDRQSALSSLARLADRLGEPGSTEFGTTSALARLATDPAFTRFLLVYDNADDPAMLEDLLPGEHRGHVVVTSTAASSPAVAVVEMAQRESGRLLADRVPGLSTEDAARVADAANHLPLALQLAGAWLEETAMAERLAGASVADAAAWAARAFLERLEPETEDVPRQGTVARVVAVLTETLRETAVGRLAVLLAQTCSFLSSQGVDFGLVRSQAMIDRIRAAGGADAEPLRLDAGEIDRVLWTGARYGMFRVDWGERNSLRLHRVVQAALRDAMSPSERDDRRAGVLSALAAFAPTEVEESAPHREARFAELQNHVFSSGAVHSDDDEVRRWLVNQVRFLFTNGGAGVRAAAVAPAQQLLDDWTARFGAADPLRSRLAAQLANLHRVLGDRTKALRLDDSALAQQRRSLQLTHPQALISARGRGGDLRGLGLFAEALEEDQSTWEGFREALGEDHPHTRMASNNLAVSLFLSGDVRAALVLEEDNYRRRRRLFGQQDPDTWWSLANIGVYQRELGRYPQALKALLNAVQHLQRLRPQLNATELAVRWHLAVTMRRDGNPKSAKERNGRTLRGYKELVGPDHPDTLACTLSFAADHRAVGGDPALAVELATTALDGFLTKVRLAEQHPFVALCRIGLGLSLCAAGRGSDGVVQTSAGLATLLALLGDTHPWTLAAMVDHARVTIACGDVENAVELIGSAHRNCVEFLGEDHPHTRVAAHNLRLALDPAGRPNDQEWRDIDVDIPQT